MSQYVARTLRLVCGQVPWAADIFAALRSSGLNGQMLMERDFCWDETVNGMLQPDSHVNIDPPEDSEGASSDWQGARHEERGVYAIIF